jgi:hypothetical protein
MKASAWSTRRTISAPSVPALRKPNATLSHTLSQAKVASSWNTTPIPSATVPVMARPSISMVPDVGVTSPAMISSSVLLPQPEGPTTPKNSPRLNSKSSRPSAGTGPWSARAG